MWRLLGALLILTGCTDGTDAGSSPTGARSDAAELESTPDAPAVPLWGGSPLAPGQVRFVVDKEFSVNDAVLRAGIGIFDPAAKSVYLGVAAKNVSVPEADLPSALSLDVGNGTPITGRIQNRVLRVPQGLTTVLTVQFSNVAAFDPSTAKLLVGDPRTPLRTVPLAAGATFTDREAELPRTWPLDVWGTQGKYHFHFTEARLLPRRFAGGYGLPPELVGDRILELTFDLWSTGRDTTWGFAPNEHVRLRRPDGLVLEAIANSPIVIPHSYSAFTGVRVQFPVKPEIEGDHTLLLNGRSQGFTLNSAVNLAVTEVPFPLTPPPPTPAILGPPSEPRRPAEILAAGTPATPTTTTAPTGVEDSRISARLVSAGVVYTFDRAQVDRVKGQVTLSGGSEIVATKPPEGTGALSIPSPGVDVRGSFYLAWDDNLVAGSPAKTLIPWTGGPISVVFNIPTTAPAPGTIDIRFSLAAAGLAFVPGRPLQGGWADTLTAALGPDATIATTGPAVEVRSFTGSATTTTTGPWTTRVVSGRIGPLRNAFPPAPGWTIIELTVEATLAPTAPAEDFVTQGQTFLRRPDGYLITAKDAIRLDGDGNHAKGEKGTYLVTFDVPSNQLSAQMTYIMRSKDETYAPLSTDKTWIEGNLPFTLPPDALAATEAIAPPPVPLDG